MRGLEREVPTTKSKLKQKPGSTQLKPIKEPIKITSFSEQKQRKHDAQRSKAARQISKKGSFSLGPPTINRCWAGSKSSSHFTILSNIGTPGRHPQRNHRLPGLEGLSLKASNCRPLFPFTGEKRWPLPPLGFLVGPGRAQTSQHHHRALHARARARLGPRAGQQCAAPQHCAHLWPDHRRSGIAIGVTC